MKNTRIIFAFFLTVVLLLSSSFSCWAAAESSTSPVISLGEYNVSAGGTVTVRISLAGNPGITYLRLTPVYSSEHMTLESVTNGELFSTLDTGVNLVWSADSEVKSNGTLAEIVFRISENAPLNSSLTVSFTLRECYDDDYNDINIKLTEGKLNLGCSHPERTERVKLAPTCKTAGEKLLVCSACGDQTIEAIPALGHSEGEWKTIKAPGIGIDGEMITQCTVCGETVRSQNIPALSGDPSGGTDNSGDQAPQTAPPATGGCFSGAQMFISLFVSTLLPAIGVILLKKSPF
ncbi:MAG: hypothetical protein IJY04_05185 [Clostridia bacterium]|nr:hypothetical protein [Clostridia bacterium]